MFVQLALTVVSELTCHWYPTTPEATTENDVELAPHKLMLLGCVVMDGAQLTVVVVLAPEPRS